MLHVGVQGNELRKVMLLESRLLSLARKNSRTSHRKVKARLFRDTHSIDKSACGLAHSEGRAA